MAHRLLIYPVGGDGADATVIARQRRLIRSSDWTSFVFTNGLLKDRGMIELAWLGICSGSAFKPRGGPALCCFWTEEVAHTVEGSAV